MHSYLFITLSYIVSTIEHQNVCRIEYRIRSENVGLAPESLDREARLAFKNRCQSLRSWVSIWNYFLYRTQNIINHYKHLRTEINFPSKKSPESWIIPLCYIYPVVYYIHASIYIDSTSWYCCRVDLYKSIIIFIHTDYESILTSSVYVFFSMPTINSQYMLILKIIIGF